MGSFSETYNHLPGRECMKFCILRTYITVCNRDVFVFKSNLLYTYRAGICLFLNWRVRPKKSILLNSLNIRLGILVTGFLKRITTAVFNFFFISIQLFSLSQSSIGC